ncbi:hypothetical protein [Labrenzia sp. CP4]|jgi:hypothetical protein|nr:hypothetical protein [Labrenzia sp. CP4]
MSWDPDQFQAKALAAGAADTIRQDKGLDAGVLGFDTNETLIWQ